MVRLMPYCGIKARYKKGFFYVLVLLKIGGVNKIDFTIRENEINGNKTAKKH